MQGETLDKDVSRPFAEGSAGGGAFLGMDKGLPRQAPRSGLLRTAVAG